MAYAKTKTFRGVPRLLIGAKTLHQVVLGVQTWANRLAEWLNAEFESIQLESSPTTTKGDIEVHNGTTLVRLGVGAYHQGILADSSQAAGLKWGDIPSILDRAAAQLDIVNTSSETTLYSFSIPAAALGSERAIRIRIVGDYLNNSGANRNITVRIKIGSTTMYGDSSAAIPAGADRLGFEMNLIIGNQNATNAQVLGGFVYFGGPGASAGIGNLGTDEVPAHTSVGGSAAEDSTGALTVTVTVQHSAADANVSIRRQYALAELI